MGILDLKEEIYNYYFDDQYQVTVVRSPGHWTTGNGTLHLGIFITLLGLNKSIADTDKLKFNIAIDRCWVRDGKGNPILGLLNRNQGRPDLEGQDDYIGVCAGGVFAGTNDADCILKYGEENLYCYDNSHPYQFSLRSWHSRFPGLIGYYRICAGKSPGFFQELCLKTKLLYGPSDSPSDNILTWLSVQVIKKKYAPLFVQCQKWESKLIQKYGSLGGLFRLYFGDSHPFSRIESSTGVI